MPDTAGNSERVIKVAEIDPRVRHTIIMQLFANLDAENSLQLVSDHDPRPLRFQLESLHGSRCDWHYLEQGPDVWRVRLRYVVRSGDRHA
jgi:uncharacterized protein (DUF2249 family)